MRNKILAYDPILKELAKKLRNDPTPGEKILWRHVRNKASGVEFHRQVPIDKYIVDFYSHEIQLAIEIDGGSHDHEDVHANDILRQNKLEELGIKVIRIAERDVKHDTDNVLYGLGVVIQQLMNGDRSRS